MCSRVIGWWQLLWYSGCKGDAWNGRANGGDGPQSAPVEMEGMTAVTGDMRTRYHAKHRQRLASRLPN